MAMLLGIGAVAVFDLDDKSVGIVGPIDSGCPRWICRTVCDSTTISIRPGPRSASC